MKKIPIYLILIFLLSLQNISSIEEGGFLHFDLKKDCPNPRISSLGILISLSESEDSSYENTLSEEDRTFYEEMIQLKRSFSGTMDYIPQSFSPETETYWEQLNHLLIIFMFIAIFPLIFILFYLFMRFVLKKCAGPKKIKQVTKTFRNFTWIIMIVFSILTLILFSIVLARSEKVRDNTNNSFDFAVKTIQKATDSIKIINETLKKLRTYDLTYPIPSEEYMINFGEDIAQYINDTNNRTQQILDDENKRGNITLAIYITYLIVIFLAYLFFFLKKEIFELIISLILFFAIPGLLILEGYNAKFFFYYSDICDSVNSALYSNQFPVADQSLGFYYNCFPTNIKATLYNIRYKIYENLNDKDDIVDIYNNVMKDAFDPLFNCEIVNNVLPNIEREFCKNSLNYMYSIITLLTWILLSGLGVAIGSRRLQVLIWKKKMEIEEMIENKEVIF